MDRFERIDRAIHLEEPDKVPLWDLLNIPENVFKLLTNMPLQSTEHWIKTMADLGWDMVTAAEGTPKAWQRPKNSDFYTSEWGARYKRVYRKGFEAWVPIGGTIETPKDLEKFEIPDPHNEERIKPIIDLTKAARDKMPVVVLLHDAWEFPCYMRGLQNLLVDLHRNPTLVHRLARISINYNIEKAKIALDAGAVGVVSGDDYCYKEGPLMSPKHFKEYIFPYLKKLVDVVHKRGGWFMKHCDGWVIPIIDQIIAAGVDALNPLEKQAGMNLKYLKENYGDKLCLSGNVDCGHTLELGTEAETAKETLECIQHGAPGGGYILSTSNSIHAWVKPQNVKTMFEISKKYGWYPR